MEKNKILIIDSPYETQPLKELLELVKYKVDVTESIDDSIKKITNKDVDLILLEPYNCAIPNEVNGKLFLLIKEAKDRDIPVLIYSHKANRYGDAIAKLFGLKEGEHYKALLPKCTRIENMENIIKQYLN